MAITQDDMKADSEWPVDEMPAMPLAEGKRMVRIAMRELYFLYAAVDYALIRQHLLAVREADNKWRIQQAQLKTESAKRFRIIALGLATLGGTSVIILIIRYFLTE